VQICIQCCSSWIAPRRQRLHITTGSNSVAMETKQFPGIGDIKLPRYNLNKKYLNPSLCFHSCVLPGQIPLMPSIEQSSQQRNKSLKENFWTLSAHIWFDPHVEEIIQHKIRIYQGLPSQIKQFGRIQYTMGLKYQTWVKFNPWWWHICLDSFS
jgi:hypothetical protein